MKIAIGADHAGFALKEILRRKLIDDGHEVFDAGTSSSESTDYPDYAGKVARRVAAGQSERGVLVCSSGVGMTIAANKVNGIRAAVAVNDEQAEVLRSHNDANVVALGARFTSEEDARRMVDIFLKTEFEGGRHARRVDKVRQLEQANSQGADKAE